MNHALTLRPPTHVLLERLLMLSLAFWLASAVSLAPTLRRTASVASDSGVCKCAHCSGGLTCCCRLTGKCPIP